MVGTSLPRATTAAIATVRKFGVVASEYCTNSMEPSPKTDSNTTNCHVHCRYGDYDVDDVGRVGTDANAAWG